MQQSPRISSDRPERSGSPIAERMRRFWSRWRMPRLRRPIGRLSGGQKARLGMLLLRLAQPNFYLLDEPTNHLDIEGQEALEDELMDHQASCLLVSHDRSFVRTVGNRFWLIDRKKLVELEGPEAFFASAGATG